MKIKTTLAAFTLLSLVMSACSKEKTNAPTATNPSPGPAAQQPFANKPAPPPAPKPQGPLQSRQGSRIAKFELMPNGRFAVTALAKNRQDPDPIDATELVAIVMCGGETERLKLAAKPSEKDAPGKASRFSGFSTLLQKGTAASFVVTFPGDEPKNAQFEIPAGYKSF